MHGGLIKFNLCLSMKSTRFQGCDFGEDVMECPVFFSFGIREAQRWILEEQPFSTKVN